MTTRILFFGQLRETAGRAETAVDLPPSVATRSALIDWLAKDDPALHAALNQDSVRLCIDKKVVLAEATFSAPNEIAFLPPFSGG